MAGFFVEKNMAGNELDFKPNMAVAELANYVSNSGEPFVFHKDNVGEIMAEGKWPFADVLLRMQAFERDRIAEGVQVLTFKPDRTYGFTTTGYGRGLFSQVTTTIT